MEPNFATNQQLRDRDHTPLEMCRNIGRSHAQYKWSRTPDGHWNEEQRQAYFNGFDNVKDTDKPALGLELARIMSI